MSAEEALNALSATVAGPEILGGLVWALPTTEKNPHGISVTGCATGIVLKMDWETERCAAP